MVLSGMREKGDYVATSFHGAYPVLNICFVRLRLIDDGGRKVSKSGNAME